ncbi:MAG TPA: C40 family peptidase [Novimethylophilus sp.]|jgi:cell wall-associated NlpC family hydrolase|uniref:C40 family peptidase n=1 Tax=Novimethylophilus sp. TaxID=2137426 RepID=UPI002F4032B3
MRLYSLIFAALFGCAASLCHADEAASAGPDFLKQAGSAMEQAGSAMQDVLLSALALSGTPYKFGGNTPDTGFDCSGFVRFVFSQAANLTLPHGARAISQLGKSIPVDQLQPGDLVFFNTLKHAFSHVGIYLGDGRFIHAPSSGGGVHIVSMNDAYWAKRFNGARRLDQSTAQQPADVPSE